MGTMLGDTARMARRGAGHAAGGIRDGRTDGQVVIPICQTDPVPKALLQTCQSPSCPRAPSDPGAEPLPDGAMRVKARSGKAFPHRPCPVNLRLHREAKQTPGRAESAARPVPGAGPASPPSQLEQGKDKSTQPGHRDRSQLEELLPLHGTAALELLWHKLGKGDMWGDIHPSCCSTEGVTGG